MRAIALLLLLSACSASDNAADAPTQNAASAEPARFELNTPLFNASVAVPSGVMNGGDFDMNGVPLPPGSVVRGIAVHADAPTGQPTLTLRFASPEAPAAVRDWLLPRLREVGYTLDAAADGLRGTTDEGKPFRLALAAENGGSAGTIELAD